MWPFSQPKKVEGQAQAAFDHPKTHRELNGGMGVSPLSIAAGNLSGQFTARLRRVDELVQGAINRCHRSWSGSASEAMTQESSPFRNVVHQSEELSATLAKGVEGQGEHFSRTKNSMPAPHNVPPLDLGFSDLAPTNLGAKLAGQQIHESKHNEAEQKAREDYTAYRTTSNSTVQSLQPYPAVPASVADVGVADTQSPNAVDPSTGYAGTGSSTSSSRVSSDHGTGDTSPGNPDRSSQPDQSGAPAESGSAWVSPTTSGAGVTPPPSAGTGGAPVGGGIGVGFVPGTGGTPGTGTGRSAGGFGSGKRGGSGVRSGPGIGGRGGLGPGGSSGVGGSGSGVTGSGGARGGSGALGGVAGPGQRGRDAEDEEHERKYIKDSDEHFEFDPEVDPDTGLVIAPPVIGGPRPATSGHEGKDK